MIEDDLPGRIIQDCRREVTGREERIEFDHRQPSRLKKDDHHQGGSEIYPKIRSRALGSERTKSAQEKTGAGNHQRNPQVSE